MTMTTQEWQRVGKLLDDLLDLSDVEREQALQKLRQDDPALCEEVESLLEYRQPTVRLQAPPSGLLTAAVGAVDHEPTPLAPDNKTASQLPEIAGYEVLELLARGGMGVVYRARHRTLGHEVALKMIVSGEYAGPDERARFLLEAAAVAKMQHPGIVHIHEFGEHAGNPYFSLEFLAGGSLAQRLRERNQLPAREAAALLEKLARAMQHAHEHGIIHRDLKPGNVLFTVEGEPKIADFGLAKQLNVKDGLSETGNILGTPSYMAPEQAAGQIRALGPATDVYALGVILYECLTGQVPIQGSTTFETLQLVLHQEPAAPRGLVRHVPRDLETICLRCLEKEPGRRYASAAALADDLGRFLHGIPVAARPVGAVERSWRWCRRNPAVASLLTLVVLALTAGTVVSTLFGLNAARQADRAIAARGIAETREQQARHEADRAMRARDFLISIFRISEKDIRAGNITARQILDQAEERIPREFAGQPELSAELLTAIGDVKRNLLRNIPVAMVLEVSGTLQLHASRGQSLRPAPQMLLYPDDRLTLAADAQIQLVFLADLHKERLKPSRVVTIGRDGCLPAEAVDDRNDDVLLNFVRLPKETFYMGWDDRAMPPKKGTKTAIKEDFEIAIHAVTQGQWQAIMGNNPSWFSRQGEGKSLLQEVSDEELKLFPVESVSWENVQAFIERLNKRESTSGYQYRLPTPAEWQYSCRAGATTEEECSFHFYFDKPANSLSSEQANFDGTRPFGNAMKGPWLQRTTRVGAYPLNKLGLCDMHGNVGQICVGQVICGGAWNYAGRGCSASTSMPPPNNGMQTNFIGFRLVRVAVRNNPRAMILEGAGSIQLSSTHGDDRRPVPQTLLHLGDRLTLAADARMKIIWLRDLHKEQIKPGRAITVGPTGCEPADAIVARDNDILMTFARLPKGTFFMGGGGSKPGTKTEIKEDFEIAMHTVTQGQWQALMGSNPSFYSRTGPFKDVMLDITDDELKLHPVENVSWDDAQVFIKKLNERERARGYLYRLPTEAEWEYACRAGATTVEDCSSHFYFDRPTNDLSSDLANFKGEAPVGKAPKGAWLNRTTRVGAYPTNKLGLCDLHGNVYQWCADLRLGPFSKTERVIRGGSYMSPGHQCAAGFRAGYEPTQRIGFIGFRLVRVPVRSIPVAMILEATASIQLHSSRAGNPRPVAQTLLYPDDRLTLGADAGVQLVFLSDLHKERLKPGGEVTIGPQGCASADVVRERDDDILLTFVRLPQGTFFMGGGGGKPGAKTEIKVDFEIAVHAVTQGQWLAVMGTTPSEFSRTGQFQNRVLDITDNELNLHPVDNVSWNDAQEFIKKLNERERARGYLYRLPTEAEWEYACRAGATTEEDSSYLFYFDRPTNDLSSDKANFKGDEPVGTAPKGKWLQRTARVGMYPANKLGLCDMHGNVWQWCADLFQEGKPTRSIRGGGWNVPGNLCCANMRAVGLPTDRSAFTGFRLVRVPRR